MKIREHFPCLKILKIAEVLLFKRHNDDDDVLTKPINSLDTIVVPLPDRMVMYCEVQIFFDAAIKKYSELQSWLCTISRITESNNFKTSLSKIQLYHHSQLTDIERNTVELLHVVQEQDEFRNIEHWLLAALAKEKIQGEKGSKGVYIDTRFCTRHQTSVSGFFGCP